MSGIVTSAPMAETVYTAIDNHNTTMAPPLCRDVPCIFYAVVNSFISVLGVAGNALVIWIAGFKIKKSVNATWYLSLAVSDIMFCFFLPLGIVHVVRNDWIFGHFMCKFMFYLMYLNWFSSIFILVIISVDRCVAVMFPVWAQNQRTVRKASLIVVLAWMISAVLSMPSFFVLDVEYGHYFQGRGCFSFYQSHEQEIAHVVSRFVFLFVIPFLIIISCYFLIARKLKSDGMAKSKKPFKIMTVLIAVFLICWLPHHTFTLMALNKEEYYDVLVSGFQVAIVFANVNSCINPFLYAFMGKDFKNQCHAILSKIENAMQEEEEGQNRLQQAATVSTEENNVSSTV